jgi:Uma2 family endonuclease
MAESRMELLDQRSELMPITLDQYQRMIDSGILMSGDPYELLDGYLFRKDRSAEGEDPMTVGHEHIWVVQRLVRLSARLNRLGFHMRVQQPIALPPRNAPEPDGAVAIGTEDDYVDSIPGVAQTPCVIEVADSSLRRDRTTKLRIYASGGIAQYLIINLPDRVVEVYTEPLKEAGHYGQSITLRPGRSVEFQLGRGKKLAIPVKTLLP